MDGVAGNGGERLGRWHGPTAVQWHDLGHRAPVDHQVSRPPFWTRQSPGAAALVLEPPELRERLERLRLAGDQPAERHDLQLRARLEVKVRDPSRALERDGWHQVNQRGCHRQFRHPVKPGRVTVAGHMAQELAPGTLGSVFRQAVLSREGR